ncbi:GntR family transcriptional regulator [Alsobacter sp. SYSU BS001988]
MSALPPASLTLPTLPSARLERGRQAAPQVFEWLRGSIIDLSLPPGTVLSRADLAQQFGVSSTPVRDALMRLQEEGLVDVFPQHATVVSPIDIRAVNQAHFLRRSLEIETVRTVARAPSGDLAERLGRSVARMQAMFELQDFEGFANEDEAFHRQLFEAAGVPDLWPLVRSRSGHLDRLRRLHLPSPGKGEAILKDHAAVVAAIAAADPDAAEACMRRHLAGTVANLDDIRTRHPDYLRS